MNILNTHRFKQRFNKSMKIEAALLLLSCVGILCLLIFNKGGQLGPFGAIIFCILYPMMVVGVGVGWANTSRLQSDI